MEIYIKNKNHNKHVFKIQKIGNYYTPVSLRDGCYIISLRARKLSNLLNMVKNNHYIFNSLEDLERTIMLEELSK